MDNLADIEYQIIEEKYLNDNAKFNKGDVVYYEYVYNKNNQQKLGLSIGIAHERLLLRNPIVRNGKPDSIMVVGYRIINPRGIITITEPKITSASEYIFREYLKHKKPAE